MFAFAFFASIIALCFGQQVDNRNGQVAQFRVFSELFQTTATVAGTTDAFQNTNLVGTFAIGANLAVPGGNHAPGLGTFATVDLGGAARTLTLSHTNGVGQNSKIVCTAQIQPNTRNTVFVDMEVVNQVTTIGTCAAAGATCAPDEVSAGTVNFPQCTVFSETLTGPTCDLEQVNFFRFDTDVCPKFIQRTNADIVNLGADEAVFLSDPVGTQNPDQRFLDASSTFTLNGQPILSTEGSIHDIFITDATTSENTLQTGFVSILNAGFTSSAGALAENNYQVAVFQGTSGMHLFQAVTPATASGFVELPVGTYQILVYRNNPGSLAIFGDKTTNPITAPTATAFAQGNVVVASKGYHVVVIHGSAVSTTNVASAIVQAVDVTQTVAATEGTTQFNIYNVVQTTASATTGNAQTSLKFANPDADACNFLSTNDLVSSTTPSALTVDSDALDTIGSTTFSVYPGGVNCGTLGSAIPQASLTLNNAAAGTACARKAVFLVGRAVNVDSTIAGCTTSTLRIGDLNFVAPTAISGALTAVSIDVPACDCVEAVAESCDVCLSSEFDAVQQQLAQVSSNVGSIARSVNNDVVDTLEDLEDDLGDIEDDIGDVESDIDDAEDRVKKTNNNLEEVIEGVHDDVNRANNQLDRIEDAIDGQ